MAEIPQSSELVVAEPSAPPAKIPTKGGKSRQRLFAVLLGKYPAWDDDDPENGAFLRAGYPVATLNSDRGYTPEQAKRRALEMANWSSVLRVRAAADANAVERGRYLLSVTLDVLEENLSAVKKDGTPHHSVRQQAAYAVLQLPQFLGKWNSLNIKASREDEAKVRKIEERAKAVGAENPFLKVLEGGGQ